MNNPLSLEVLNKYKDKNFPSIPLNHKKKDLKEILEKHRENLKTYREKLAVSRGDKAIAQLKQKIKDTKFALELFTQYQWILDNKEHDYAKLVIAGMAQLDNVAAEVRNRTLGMQLLTMKAQLEADGEDGALELTKKKEEETNKFIDLRVTPETCQLKLLWPVSRDQGLYQPTNLLNFPVTSFYFPKENIVTRLPDPIHLTVAFPSKERIETLLKKLWNSYIGSMVSTSCFHREGNDPKVKAFYQDLEATLAPQKKESGGRDWKNCPDRPDDFVSVSPKSSGPITGVPPNYRVYTLEFWNHEIASNSWHIIRRPCSVKIPGTEKFIVMYALVKNALGGYQVLPPCDYWSPNEAAKEILEYMNIFSGKGETHLKFEKVNCKKLRDVLLTPIFDNRVQLNPLEAAYSPKKPSMKILIDHDKHFGNEVFFHERTKEEQELISRDTEGLYLRDVIYVAKGLQTRQEMRKIDPDEEAQKKKERKAKKAAAAAKPKLDVIEEEEEDNRGPLDKFWKRPGDSSNTLEPPKKKQKRYFVSDPK